MRPLFLTAATAVITTLVAGVAQADTIRFWTTENQPARLAKQQAMAEDFNTEDGPHGRGDPG
jgi:multiple sugar transport system substrate-binding protein